MNRGWGMNQSHAKVSTDLPDQMFQLRLDRTPIKVEFLTRPGAAAALPSSLTAGRPGLRLFAPPPRPSAAAPARQRRAGSWGRRAASLFPTPARPRAPLAAVGGKARANNRGLAKEIPYKDLKPYRPKDTSARKRHQLNSNRSFLVIWGIGPKVSTIRP